MPKLLLKQIPACRKYIDDYEKRSHLYKYTCNRCEKRSVQPACCALCAELTKCGKDHALHKEWLRYKFCNHGLHVNCKDCKKQQTDELNALHRRITLKRKCEACGTKLNLCLDHDHATGMYRATLCRTCNSALGFAKDDTNILKNLVMILERQKTRSMYTENIPKQIKKKEKKEKAKNTTECENA